MREKLQVKPLAPETIEALNTNVNLQFAWVEHGAPGVVHESNYDAAELIVGRLDESRGDILAVESIGHQRTEPSSEEILTSLRAYARTELDMDDIKREPDEVLVAALRERRLESNVGYAYCLAALRGIKVVKTGISAQQLRRLYGPDVSKRHAAVVAAKPDIMKYRDLLSIETLGRIAAKTELGPSMEKPTLLCMQGQLHRKHIEGQLTGQKVNFSSENFAPPLLLGMARHFGLAAIRSSRLYGKRR